MEQQLASRTQDDCDGVVFVLCDRGAPTGKNAIVLAMLQSDPDAHVVVDIIFAATSTLRGPSVGVAEAYAFAS
ncbi:MAG: hypothetical protein KF755_11735 [Burkholderiaceae bacterium]|nr:hypothetical protein [Burkholderiaceae bacterium]